MNVGGEGSDDGVLEGKLVKRKKLVKRNAVGKADRAQEDTMKHHLV